MYKSKYLGRFISCFVLLCFVGILGISTTYASDLSTLEINREEIQSVRSSGKNINDNNDTFVNNRPTSNHFLATFTSGFETDTTKQYVPFSKAITLRDNDGKLKLPTASSGGRADPSWLNRTVLINNFHNAKMELYLAQGNISNGSTVSQSENAEKANKFFLTWERSGTGTPNGTLPGGSWYNSNLSTLFTFNNYTGATGTAAQNEANGYTKGVQCFDLNTAPAYVQGKDIFTNAAAVDHPIAYDKLNGYRFNLRMPIWSLTPYLRMTEMNYSYPGHSLTGVTLSSYNQVSYYVKSGASSGTSATRTMYIDPEGFNSLIVYAGLKSDLASLDATYAKHVYTFLFDYNINKNASNKIKRWDIVTESIVTKNTRIAPSTDPDLNKKGYLLDGWYTDKEDGSKIFDKYGRPELTAASSSYWGSVDIDHCQLMKTLDTEETKNLQLNRVSGISTESNISNGNYVYTYKNDSLSERTGEFTMYAHWKPITYHVKYVYNNNVDGDDHNPNNPTEWVYDQEQQIKDPTRIGYTFAGWQVKNGEKVLISKGNKIVKNLTSIQSRTVTLVALWTPNVYKINFHSNYPNGAADQVVSWNVTYDSAEHKSDTAPGFTCTHYHMIGYTFNGSNDFQYYWYKGPNSQNYYDNIMSRSNSWWNGNKYKNPYDIDVYAKWDKNPYVIVYDSNGGSAVASELSYSGDNHILAAGPTRAGYTFVGWSKCSDVNYFGNPIDQNTRTGYYKNLAETDPLKMAQGNNSKNYFRTADANSPGDTIFNIEKWAGEVRFVAIWAHIHNEANMDNLRNGGDNGRTYPCTIDGVNSFYVNTTSQNKFYVGVGNTWMKLSPWYNINRARLLKDNNWSANNSETYNQSDFTESSLSNVFTAADSSSNNSHGARDVHKSLMTLNKRFSFTLTDDNSYNLHSSIDSTCHWTDNAHADCNVSSTANSNNTRVIGDKTKPVHDNNDWNTTVDLKNRDITNYSSMKLRRCEFFSVNSDLL